MRKFTDFESTTELHHWRHGQAPLSPTEAWSAAWDATRLLRLAWTAALFPGAWPAVPARPPAGPPAGPRKVSANRAPQCVVGETPQREGLELKHAA